LFVCPIIEFGFDKASMISKISDSLKINPENIAFIDDDPMQRSLILKAFPKISVFSPDMIDSISSLESFNPPVISNESKVRRIMIQNELRREAVKKGYNSIEEFLYSCKIYFRGRNANSSDVPRIHELALRTNRMNVTSERWDADHILKWMSCKSHYILVADMHDKFGHYGIVACALMEDCGDVHKARALWMSCRVGQKGAPHAFFTFMCNHATNAGAREVEVQYVRNNYNRMSAFHLGHYGFIPKQVSNESINYKIDVNQKKEYPKWIMNIDNIPRQGPSVLVLPITDRCNAHCTMCGIWRRNDMRDNLSVSTLREMLADYSFNRNLRFINLTGGEPTNHESLIEIVEFLFNSCIELKEISIGTNGINSELLQLQIEGILHKLPKHISLVVNISLDGPENIHNKIRGVENAYNSVKKSIMKCHELCKKYDNFKVSLNTTIINANVKYLLVLADFAKENNLDISYTYGCSNKLYLQNSMYEDSFSIINDFQTELLENLEQLKHNKYLLTYVELHYINLMQEFIQTGTRNSPCIFQNNGVFLDLDGNLYPCGTANDLCYGNLTKSSFQDCYYGDDADNIRQSLKTECCKHCISNSYYALNPNVQIGFLKEYRNSLRQEYK